MRIDSVTMPNIEGKSPERAIALLYEHCQETAVHVMRLSNEVEELKRQLADLQLRQR